MPDLDNVCGSLASHFAVSKDGELSFYQTNDAESPAPDKIALGVMLAKLARGKFRLDDVETCLVDSADVLATGVHGHRDKGGETLLRDVNEAHWCVGGVTLRRLNELVFAILTPEPREIFVSKARLAFALDAAVEAGELDVSQLTPETRADFEQVRGTKPYKRLQRERQAG